MESSSTSTRPQPPQPTSTSAPASLSTRRRTFFTPLSVHGMPKTPGGSNFRTHRFSTLRSPLVSPSPTMSSPPLTPMSPTVMSPMSPPMSAKSFGTFIESEPSTPAYSPRSGSSNWDSNTLLLLSPISSASSSPSSPVSPKEPVWEMMTPIRKAKKPLEKTRVWAKHSRTISISSSENPAKSTIPEEGQKENSPPTDEEKKDERNEKAGSTHTAPLGKMARMKSLLRRKTVSEKKIEKPEKRRRGYEDLDRMEDVHWTEM